MKCEIEFLPVGSKSRPGDSIVARYGEEGDFRLMVVDGGMVESGQALVRHLRKQYGNDVSVEHAVLTHADADHASGLRELLNEIQVEHLWMHVPWLLAPKALHLFEKKDWDERAIRNVVRKEYDILAELFDLATKAGTRIHYPFQGNNIGPFTVLSPSSEQYTYLLPQFDKTPAPDEKAIEEAGFWIEPVIRGISEDVLEDAQQWIDETWSTEHLRDGARTSPSNESSVILYANIASNRRIQLTGDAGVKALSWAVQYAKASGFPLRSFSFVQIPHHGSRSNVGPTVLNELFGPILPEGSQSKFTAYVSAPADDATHPRKMVLNAFVRRGGRVYATQGKSRVHCGGFEWRKGYSKVEAIPLSPVVEEYD
ncbi:hypothetical protein ATN79_44870 [Paraburkholderia caribensis]|nr:hypothetical protein ATN79_44870 [Paraburkholderia caribensis]